MTTWKPTREQSQFIKRYAEALGSGDAALFAGAGLSRAAGYVDWRDLLREVAIDLELNVDRESDLVALAQYHLNEKRGTRWRLNQSIVDRLSDVVAPTRTHRILARLPIQTAWTTNYDRLLEHAFEEAGKVVDLKLSQENLVHTRPGRDVVLYKMHGCVTQPHEAVIAKDDYEQYEKERPLFVESLKGDLIGKTFLFLGFSFTDPNIDYILSRVRILLGANVREHFCVMRRPQPPEHPTPEQQAEYDYEMRKTALHHTDLLRFGIETVWVDEFSDIEPLLTALSSFVHRKAVFVSGAAFNPAPFGRDRLDKLAREIGIRLMREGYDLVSGFGFGLGEQCVIGALRGLYGVPKGRDMNRLVVRPFPRVEPENQPVQNTRHREDLIARAGVLVVIAGNRKREQSEEIENSPGVFEEVDIALRERKTVIPIGATGHAAKEIWEKAMAEPECYLPGIEIKGELETLGDPNATNEQLLDALFKLLAKSEKVVTL
uniref:NAD(+) hydrolase ThsA n=1 Tax=Candidatus Kentrum sp. MB TaxID=2138164 RepID=A0A450XGM3_9GAMM|nr:MAG: SIR2-like domain-containing protein [Candidatus Kentron sp. MB]VFK28338.1 MAG: SIR2-like domain-containing protein [Candidatus Kentron sp. MB]VFK74210.1 MAG: SIR2-like domain-containing protein [Candidatus Kentron sp. MB]